MTQDPRAQADSTVGIRLGDQESSASSTSLFAEPSKLTRVAQTLAAHGGGSLSVDLALDIVLNDVVEQARSSTGATGAAIALFRDGELVCRATSGENAPDMGVRVDAHSGLAGACVSTGEIQQCQDTDTDARINAETCRQLGVRSMLIAPLVDGQRLIGIIQVFSAWPNAFGKREISALQVIAGRIAESNREAETGISTPAADPKSPGEPSQAASDQILSTEISSAEIPPAPIPEESVSQEEETISLPVESEPRRPFDVWGVALVVLVIATALLLGLVIGWRRAAEFTKQSAPVRTNTASSAPVVPTSAEPAQGAPAPNENAALETPGDVSVKKAPLAPPPAGGLVVTQNGKVVYRSSPDAAGGNASESGEHSLVRKVDPEYPAEAKVRHVQGPVVLDVEVLRDGAVGTVAVVSGDPLLAQSAIDAVKQWRYRPEAGDGQGLERRTRVTVNFKLPES
jgi:TonB family protein